MSRKARHRADRPAINWLWEYRALKNRWLFFWKPQIRNVLHKAIGKG